MKLVRCNHAHASLSGLTMNLEQLLYIDFQNVTILLLLAVY